MIYANVFKLYIYIYICIIYILFVDNSESGSTIGEINLFEDSNFLLNKNYRFRLDSALTIFVGLNSSFNFQLTVSRRDIEIYSSGDAPYTTPLPTETPITSSGMTTAEPEIKGFVHV